MLPGLIMKTVDRVIFSAIALGLFAVAFRETPPVTTTARAVPPSEEIVAVDIVRIAGKDLTFRELPVTVVNK